MSKSNEADKRNEANKGPEFHGQQSQTVQPGANAPPVETAKPGDAFGLEQNPNKYDAPPNTLNPAATLESERPLYDPRTGKRLDETPVRRPLPERLAAVADWIDGAPDPVRDYFIDLEEWRTRTDKNVFGAGGG